jgi:poly-gamma-glutamate capsule biosynthesis protein CapA/YwtB (metallophosphatase superfamily)
MCVIGGYKLLLNKRLMGLAACIFIFGFFLSGCDLNSKPGLTISQNLTENELQPTVPPENGNHSPEMIAESAENKLNLQTILSPAPTPVVTKAELSAIGDILIHNTVYQDASQPDGTYNFKPMFKEVKDIIHEADLAIANQETVIGGSELGLSSFPLFNSPHEVGDALLDSGISIVTTANNHAMDMGEKGILSASNYWNKIGMPYTGSFISLEDRDKARTITKNNITFSFLAYSYGTNGIVLPPNKSYLVNLFDEDTMKRDIEKAKNMSDVVVVSTHWGIENQTMPNDSQKSLAQELADWGADIIIGTHPHVLQPIKWITRKDGKRSLVMFSLGNFLSAQDQKIELVGGIGHITVVKTNFLDKTSIELKEPTFIPTYNKYENFRHFEIIPLSQLKKLDKDQIESEWEAIKHTMKDEMPELTIRG